MKNLNNPAARLHALLHKAKQNADLRNKPSTEAWSMLLNAATNNQALMLKRLGGVMELPSIIKARIENLAEVEHDLYLRWLPKVEEAFRANHLAGGFNGFIDKIDDTTLLGIEHCAAILSRRDPDPEIKPEELESLRQRVDGLIKETTEAEIDTDLKRFVLKHLFAIRNAIDEYQVFGSKPLVTAFGEAVAAVYTDPQTAIKASTSPQGIKFWKCVAGLSVLLTVGDQGLKLTEGVLKLLQPPHDTVIEVQIDSASKSNLSHPHPQPNLPTEKKHHPSSP
jgi:hypothetical protein